MNLYQLFLNCLRADYTQIENDGSYSLKKQGNTLYIYLEGSNGKIDWKNNLDFHPIRLPSRAYKDMSPGWFAHKGFLRVWKSIERHIERDILDPQYRKIVTVGYSHGAALAVLCHEFVWFHRPDLREHLEGYGFGCPRVYWGIRRREVVCRWDRFVVIRNLNDVVTYLPPAWLGFSHVGRILEIGERGRYSHIDAHRAQCILNELKYFSNRNSSALYNGGRI
jgi:predicted lipase